MLLAIHVATGLVVFFVLPTLVEDLVAAMLTAAYVCHPLLAPFLNDVNTIYILWGLLFSALTL